MRVTAIKTRKMTPPRDDLFAVVRESLTAVPERSVVAVSSKVVAIYQGRCVRRKVKTNKAKPLSKDEVGMKEWLIKKEADWYLPMERFEARSVPLTIKDGLMIPAAGIDVSNGNGYYVLWPERVEEFCREMWQWVRREYGVKEVGVVVADSHVTPLRWGVTGIALGYWGFKSLRDYSEERDVFGRKSLRWVQVAVADATASAAVMVMGEGSEQTPLALVEEVKMMEFGDQYGGGLDLKEKAGYDLFKPLIDEMEWIKGGGGLSGEEVEELNLAFRD